MSETGQCNCPGAATAGAASSGAYGPNTTTSSSPDVKTGPSARETVAPERLRQVLSEERLATYEAATAAQGHATAAVHLYAWNIAVSSAYWGSFSVLEIALRNAMHRQLARHAGREDWWLQQPSILRDADQVLVNKASQTATQFHAPCSAGHVVAELTFGFWVGLLANRYHKRLWEPILSQAFPHLAERRRDLHRKLESLRKLRNRIAHHEPIFARSLNTDHEHLLSVLGAISPDAVKWTQECSRVVNVLSQRDAVLAGNASITF